MLRISSHRPPVPSIRVSAPSASGVHACGNSCGLRGLANGHAERRRIRKRHRQQFSKYQSRGRRRDPASFNFGSGNVAISERIRQHDDYSAERVWRRSRQLRHGERLHLNRCERYHQLRRGRYQCGQRGDGDCSRREFNRKRVRLRHDKFWRRFLTRTVPSRPESPQVTFQDR